MASKAGGGVIRGAAVYGYNTHLAISHHAILRDSMQLIQPRPKNAQNPHAIA
ncbi:hypothetical protein [Proteus mirabilis]|uniref:hypothetical protein n=1 Tax=Proteus mirabilis TaxID=584 RepID=UPI0024E16437|nr:hypothetical protein [Proteus mirabilis]